MGIEIGGISHDEHLPREDIQHYRSEDDDETEERKLYKALFFLSLPPLLYSIIVYLV